MWFILGIVALVTGTRACIPSVTTVSGTHAPTTVCSGALIFADDFEEFDLEKWQHENTLAGGGNWEFQYYNNNRTNSFAQDGKLFIRPSLTSDQFSPDFLVSGTLNVEGGAPADRCTNPQWYGCERTGNPTNILNPIKSARIRTVNSFSFRYGRVEIRAKMPAGDWLWPAIWLMPTYNSYGTWPASGEIDLVESRGNRNMFQNGVHIGTQEAGSTLHFGPYPDWDEWERAHWVRRNNKGYDSEFHRYQLEWTPDYLKFMIDDVELGRVTPGQKGFWEYGGFSSNPNVLNPWRYGTKMAPFDQKFYLIINLAVGGVNGYFPDGVKNPAPKPWSNNSPRAAADFWNARNSWLPTWTMHDKDGQSASLQVDYTRVWALCTNPQWYGCERIGNPTNILNPIKSARIRTVNSFSFRYGRVEIRAKMPAGDWLWPVIWLMPTHSSYGTWPASGEIDLVESRGNRNMSQNEVHIGTQQTGSTLHFGPYPGWNEYQRAHWVRQNDTGYDSEFHLYQLEWTPDYLKFTIDDVELGRVTPGQKGFWEYGGFSSNPNVLNPWRYGTKMAPFDQKFYLIINLAVGGVNGFFPDGVTNPEPKPWSNNSPRAATDFWDARNSWLPTWKMQEKDGQSASLQVDYTRVWAL